MSITDANDFHPVLTQNLLDKFNKAYNPRIIVKCVEPYETDENALVVGVANFDSCDEQSTHSLSTHSITYESQ